MTYSPSPREGPVCSVQKGSTFNESPCLVLDKHSSILLPVDRRRYDFVKRIPAPTLPLPTHKYLSIRRTTPWQLLRPPPASHCRPGGHHAVATAGAIQRGENIVTALGRNQLGSRAPIGDSKSKLRPPAATVAGIPAATADSAARSGCWVRAPPAHLALAQRCRACRSACVVSADRRNDDQLRLLHCLDTVTALTTPSGSWRQL